MFFWVKGHFQSRFSVYFNPKKVLKKKLPSEMKKFQREVFFVNNQLVVTIKFSLIS